MSWKTGGTDTSGSLWMAPGGTRRGQHTKGQGCHHDKMGEKANRKTQEVQQGQQETSAPGTEQPQATVQAGD